jgi:hypothetical protein
MGSSYSRQDRTQFQLHTHALDAGRARPRSSQSNLSTAINYCGHVGLIKLSVSDRSYVWRGVVFGECALRFHEGGVDADNMQNGIADASSLETCESKCYEHESSLEMCVKCAPA